MASEVSRADKAVSKTCNVMELGAMFAADAGG